MPVPRAPADLLPTVPSGAVAVFVGNLLPLVRDDLGMSSTAQYHQHKHQLIMMGCVAQLRRGVRLRVGAWALLAPPTPQRWDEAVRRPFSRRVEHEHRERHAFHVEAFVAERLGGRRELLAKVADQGEVWLRAAFPRVPCLGYHGGPHTCGVADLDVLAPSRSAGSWKRRQNHLAVLRDQAAR